MGKDKKQLSEQEKTLAASKRKLAKSAKFVELATKRVNKALLALHNISKLANRNSYEYSTDQVQKILAAVEKGGRDMATAFTAPTAAKSAGFTL